MGPDEGGARGSRHVRRRIPIIWVVATGRASFPSPPQGSSAGWMFRRRWALGGSVVLVVTGLAYSFFWGPVVHHVDAWLTPGDIWGTIRAAHWIGWGDIGNIYTPGTGFITLPGIALLLAPVAMVSSALGLSASLPSYPLTHPAAWLLVGPVEMLLGAVALLALDALAERFGVGGGRRVLLCAAEAVVLWPVVALWGHPEDALAMAMGVWALIAAMDGHWARSGWLWGVGIAFQPMLLLLVPLGVALAPGAHRRRLGILVRAALPSAALVVLPFVGDWSATTRALVDQPTYPSIDHPTPWLALAPVLEKSRRVTSKKAHTIVLHGISRFTVVVSHTRTGEVVAPGPARILALVLAVGIGVWVWRRRPGEVEIVWLGAVALAGWCFFEPVMVPYYLWPALALALVPASLLGSWRASGAIAAALAATWYSYEHLGPWAWWAPLMAMVGAALLMAWPGTSVPAPQPAAPPSVSAPPPTAPTDAYAPPPAVVMNAPAGGVYD